MRAASNSQLQPSLFWAASCHLCCLNLVGSVQTGLLTLRRWQTTARPCKATRCLVPQQQCNIRDSAMRLTPPLGCRSTMCLMCHSVFGASPNCIALLRGLVDLADLLHCINSTGDCAYRIRHSAFSQLPRHGPLMKQDMLLSSEQLSALQDEHTQRLLQH